MKIQHQFSSLHLMRWINMNVHNPMFPIIGSALFYGYLIDNDFVCDAKFDSHSETTNYLEGTMFYFVPLSDYNKMMGTNETLASDERCFFNSVL